MTMKKKKKGAALGMLSGKQIRIQDSPHHGAFIQQGTVLAFPLCFPGQTVPITADESRITALDIDENGFVYGGCSGKATHAFVGMFKGVTGFVFDGDDNFFGQDGDKHLWQFSLSSGKLTQRAFQLPAGKWPDHGSLWAKSCVRDHYTFNDAGELFSFRSDQGFSEKPLAKIDLLPITTAAVTHDGRLFGFCGEGMERMFCYDPKTNSMDKLGTPVSVIERRRYGYSFAASVTGDSGQIFFGENDDLGHLWIYFPSIKPDKEKA